MATTTKDVKDDAPASKQPAKATEDSFSVPVRTAAAADKTAEPDKNALRSHHGLSLNAPSKADFENDKASSDPVINDEETTADIAPTTAPIEEEKPAESAPAEAQEEEKTDTQTETVPEQKPAEEKAKVPLGMPEEHALQEPKVFDTTQYHLPISEKKTSEAMTHVLWFFTVFVVVVLVGIVLAVDAEKLDIGVQLPFDLIK